MEEQLSLSLPFSPTAPAWMEHYLVSNGEDDGELLGDEGEKRKGACMMQAGGGGGA